MDFQTGSHRLVACSEAGSLRLLFSMDHTCGWGMGSCSSQVISLELSLSCDSVFQSAWVELQELGSFLGIKFLGVPDAY